MSRGEVLALLDGLRGREHGDRRSRGVAAEAAGVAVGRRRGASAACCRAPSTWSSPSASRWASAASATACTWSIQRGDDHRRVRPELRRVRPADHRRPRGAAAGDGLLDRRGARRAGRPRCSPALQAQPGAGRARVADRRHRRARRRRASSKDDTALIRVGDEQFVERLQSYLDLAPALRERVPDIDYVDLRFDERVYVAARGESRSKTEPAEVRED